MKHVRLLDVGATPLPLQVRDGATLNEVLAAAGVTPRTDRSLSQNGRPAKGSDPVKDQALVMRMPLANHG